MSQQTDGGEPPKSKGARKPLLIGLLLAALGGGCGFYAVQSGLLGGESHDIDAAQQGETTHAAEQVAVAFVAIDPLVISLPRTDGRDHLRFAAQLEVPPEYAAEVEAIKPRIVDILNGYLRAVEISELEDPSALMRLRGQMLRRVQIVAGEGRILDLLIMEFVLS